MEQFKDYFKFPLKMWEFMEIKVFTDDNNMAFDWLIKAPRNIKEQLIERINGTCTKPYTISKRFYHKNDGIVYCMIEDGKDAGQEIKLFRIRGWGMLTGVGGYNLDAEVAAKIQDDFMNYCIKMLNNGNE